MESPGCILAGHGYTYSATVQIQLKMRIKFTHPHISPCQMLALQQLHYQTSHSRMHIKTWINNFLLSSQRTKLVFFIPFTVSSKIKISTASTKFREFQQKKKKLRDNSKTLSYQQYFDITQPLAWGWGQGESHRLPPSAVWQVRWAGPVGQERQCCTAKAAIPAPQRGGWAGKRGWGRGETEIPLAPSVSWHIVLVGFEFTVKDKKRRYYRHDSFKIQLKNFSVGGKQGPTDP